jgi:CDP-paratose 2-epimerase
MVEQITGRPQRWTYVDQNRIGDHICYYSDLRKIKFHYPGWKITRSLQQIFQEIAESWMNRLGLAVEQAAGYAGSGSAG